MGSATHQNEDTEVHMRMNWQLWNYYHRCGYKKNFWQTLFKLLRENRISESDPGEGQLKFADVYKRQLGKSFIKALRFYVAGNNLLEFSPFKLWDPEKNKNYADGSGYPLNRVFSVGFNANF